MLAKLDELLLGALPGKVAEVEHLRRRLRVPELRRPRGRHRRLCGGLRLILGLGFGGKREGEIGLFVLVVQRVLEDLRQHVGLGINEKAFLPPIGLG